MLGNDVGRGGSPSRVDLPRVEGETGVSLERVLAGRRSVRRFADRPLSMKQAGRLLWACAGRSADGVTGATRTIPSAGGIYPLRVYLAAGSVQGLEAGVYRYLPEEHRLLLQAGGDLRRDLARAALQQGFIARAPASVVITARTARTARRYGARAQRYVHIEAGHAAQNLSLEAVALQLGTVPVGAFIDEQVAEVIGVDMKEEQPLYILPVGFPE
ncbi:MAG: SagB/ThcOx family dehydrogenase [Spirochaetota bacterium]